VLDPHFAEMYKQNLDSTILESMKGISLLNRSKISWKDYYLSRKACQGPIRKQKEDTMNDFLWVARISYSASAVMLGTKSIHNIPALTSMS
jgi:hypothetical protein